MKKVVLTLLTFIFCCAGLYSQVNQQLYNVSYYASYGFDEKKPVYYLSFSRNVSDRISIGLKGGIYNYQQTALQVANDFLDRNFGTYPAGQYEVKIDDFRVNGTTYTTSAVMDYIVTGKLQLSGSVGMKIYRQNSYYWTVRFMKFSENHLPEMNDPSYIGLQSTGSKDIAKIYYSLGINYLLGRFNIGVFGDNIYSTGVSAGVSF